MRQQQENVAALRRIGMAETPRLLVGIGYLAGSDFTETNLEDAGVLLKRKTLQDFEVVTVLPARRFALNDRLPELMPDTLEHLAQTRFPRSDV